VLVRRQIVKNTDGWGARDVALRIDGSKNQEKQMVRNHIASKRDL